MSLFWKRKSICIICLLCVFLICIIAFRFINFIVLPFSSEENITDKDVLEGSFKIFTGKYNNHIILVRYVVPWNPKEDKPHLNASQFVFYAPFNGEADRIRKDLPFWVKDLAYTKKFSVFSFTIDVGKFDILSPYTYYVYKEAGWYDLIFMLKKYIEAKFDLDHKKLLLTGESSGGSLCQQLVVDRADKIKRAAWCGGRIYTDFSETAKNVPMLCLSIDGCVGQKVSHDLAVNYCAAGFNIRHLVLSSYLNSNGKIEHHAANQRCYSLLAAFLSEDSCFDDLVKGIEE